MKNKSSHTEHDVYLEAVRKRRKLQKKKTISTPKRKKHRFETLDPDSPRGRFSAFMQQDVDPGGFGLIPDGYEGITYLTLFLFLPKLVGMGFFFFYVSSARPELYAKAHTGGFLLDWVVGYEILAALALLIIAKKLLGYMFAK